MARINSTWLVGSVESLPAQSFTIDVYGATIPAGPYYLTHATSNISLFDLVTSEMDNAAVPDPAVEFLENRLVRISASATFAITWGSATTLRDMLGFTGNLSGASSYTATLVSPYLWSAGQTVSKSTPTGSTGYSVEDATITVSADGTEQYTDFHTTHTWDEWDWPSVYLDRFDASGAYSGGTYLGFRTAVIVPGHRMQCYEIVEEDSSSSTVVTLPTVLGTYRMRTIPAGKGKRKIDNANTYWGVNMEVRLAAEYA